MSTDATDSVSVVLDMLGSAKSRDRVFASIVYYTYVSCVARQTAVLRLLLLACMAVNSAEVLYGHEHGLRFCAPRDA